MTPKLGLIGFGTIGRAIARAVLEGSAGDAQIVHPDAIAVAEESPKTGRITAMSMVKAIRNLTDPFIVGL